MQRDTAILIRNAVLSVCAMALAALALIAPGIEGQYRAAVVAGCLSYLAGLWTHSGRARKPGTLADSLPPVPPMPPALLLFAVLALASCTAGEVRLLCTEQPPVVVLPGATLRPGALHEVEPQAGTPLNADQVNLTTQAPGSITCPSGKVCLAASSSSGRARMVDTGGTGLDWGDARGFRSLTAAPSGANGEVYYNSTSSKYQFYASGSFGALPKNSGGLGADVSTGLTANHIAYVDGTGALVIGAAPAASVPAHASTHLPGGSDALTTGAPSNVGTANSAGTAAAFARQDHVHNLPFTPVQTALAAASGAVALNSQKLTGLAQGTASGEALHAGYTLTCGTGLTGCGDFTSGRTLAVNWATPGAALGSGTPQAATVTTLTVNTSASFPAGTLVYHTVTGGASGALGAATGYLSAPGVAWSTTTEPVLLVATRAGTVRNLYCDLGTAPGGADTVVVTVRKGGVDQAMTVTYTAAETGDKHDTSDTFSVAAGNRVSIKAVSSAGTAADLHCSLEVGN